MKKFLKNYWLIIFLAFIASLLISVFFIKRGNGEIQPVVNLEKLLLLPNPKFQEYPIKVSINYDDLLKNFPEIPKSETVYRVESPFFSDQEAIEVAEKFSFKGAPEFKDFENKIYYDWNTPQKDLTINLTEGKFDFNNKILNLGNTSPISLPDISSIDSDVKLILEEKGLFPDGEANLFIKNKSYLKLFGLEYGTTKNPQEAFAIEVELQYKLKDIRFLENDIILLIGDKKEILKLEYQSMFKNFQNLNTYPLKNKNEVIENLKSINVINYFKIINDYELSGESKEIKNIYLNQVELIYLKIKPGQSYLQPIFFISGQALLRDGRTAEVGIYLPAIKDEYLLK